MDEKASYPYFEDVNWGLLRLWGKRSGLRVLDVGCGFATTSARIQKLGNEVTGIESSPQACAVASQRIARVIESGSGQRGARRCIRRDPLRRRARTSRVACGRPRALPARARAGWKRHHLPAERRLMVRPLRTSVRAVELRRDGRARSHASAFLHAQNRAVAHRAGRFADREDDVQPRARAAIRPAGEISHPSPCFAGSG
jgi:SAM-dependent methyltransferase